MHAEITGFLMQLLFACLFHVCIAHAQFPPVEDMAAEAAAMGSDEEASGMIRFRFFFFDSLSQRAAVKIMCRAGRSTARSERRTSPMRRRLMWMELSTLIENLLLQMCSAAGAKLV